MKILVDVASRHAAIFPQGGAYIVDDLSGWERGPNGESHVGAFEGRARAKIPHGLVEFETSLLTTSLVPSQAEVEAEHAKWRVNPISVTKGKWGCMPAATGSDTHRVGEKLFYVLPIVAGDTEDSANTLVPTHWQTSMGPDSKILQPFFLEKLTRPMSEEEIHDVAVVKAAVEAGESTARQDYLTNKILYRNLNILMLGALSRTYFTVRGYRAGESPEAAAAFSRPELASAAKIFNSSEEVYRLREAVSRCDNLQDLLGEDRYRKLVRIASGSLLPSDLGPFANAMRGFPEVLLEAEQTVDDYR